MAILMCETKNVEGRGKSLKTVNCKHFFLRMTQATKTCGSIKCYTKSKVHKDESNGKCTEGRKMSSAWTEWKTARKLKQHLKKVIKLWKFYNF